jgi:hypothetical protein
MEETLFDLYGNPIAYIDYSNENSIYMWNGVPVAYLEPDKTVYGFNGKHLGWYENGEFRNIRGEIAGYNLESSPVYTKYEPYKSYKRYLPYKRIKQIANNKPIYGVSRSKESLAQILTSGAVG